MSENMELIEYDGHFAHLAKRAEQELIRLEVEAKESAKRRDELRKKILAVMEEKGIYKFETDNISIAYIPADVRETFDSGSLAVELPDLYQQYLKKSPMKASVRITVRKGASQ